MEAKEIMGLASRQRSLGQLTMIGKAQHMPGGYTSKFRNDTLEVACVLGVFLQPGDILMITQSISCEADAIEANLPVTREEADIAEWLTLYLYEHMSVPGHDVFVAARREGYDWSKVRKLGDELGFIRESGCWELPPDHLGKAT